MKTKLSTRKIILYLLFLALSPVPCALSQIPQGFNYQAIARLTTGDPIINTTLPVRITIQADSLGTSIIWQELHSSVTTNGFGLITLTLGKGSRQTPSTVATFSAIDWSVTPKFIKTEINYSGWKTMGVTRLWSVPYSTIAGSFGGPVKKLAVKGETALPDDALFEVKNKDGQTVFAVYNEGVRVYVSDGAKALKGGFAVGGFGTDKAESTKYLFVGKDSVRIYLDTNPLTKKLKGGFAVGGYDLTKGIVQDYLDVNSDSVRIYIDSNPATKKLKGGFAVGGYDMTKASQEQYLRVTRDSTRIYINNNPSKGLKGGFAVGGFDVVKGPVTPFTSLTPENYFIGHEGGQKTTTGKYNSVVGFQSGKNLTTGSSNVFMGYQAGLNTTLGIRNVFIGHLSGYQNKGDLVGIELGDNNIFIGAESGFSNITGHNNVYIGTSAGKRDTSGFDNVYIGHLAGYNAIAGSIYPNYRLVVIGSDAGFNLNGGGTNTFVGYSSGRQTITAHSNSFFGNNSGYKNISGCSNTYIGSDAGNQGTTSMYNTMVGVGSGYNINGNYNSFLGFNSGVSMTSGFGNTMIGTWSGEYKSDGSNNVFAGFRSGSYSGNSSFNTYIGSEAGYNGTGSRNVFLGNRAGYNETGSNIFIVDNSDTSTPLIYGDFTDGSEQLVFNGNVGIKVTPTHLIQLSGGAYSDGATWTNSSDRNLKENFESVNGEMIINLIDQLPVNKWNYNTDNPSIKHIGPVAQDFYSIFGLGNDDKSISSVDPSGVALVAIKELSKENRAMKEQIESYRSENDNLKSQLQSLQEKVEQINALVNILIANQTAHMKE